MKHLLLPLACLFFAVTIARGQVQPARPPRMNFFGADDPRIQYMGRVDHSDPRHPRFWSPGVTVRARFSGSRCQLIVDDEVLWGNSHNYIEIIIDGHASRLQTRTAHDTILVAAPPGGKAGEHTVTLCKDTESGIGYLGFDGILCTGLSSLPPPPARKIEFIGNSITCGSGIDVSETPCGKGKWYDQHNAWLSYGPITARALDAQWHITAVSGIGLMHSCCNMGEIIMPRVFDKVNQRADSIAWDFAKYIPDVVTVCLGQNDGIQDSTTFCNNYVHFIGTIRSHYPSAKIVCLTSPMADAKLTAVLQSYLTAIVSHMNGSGDREVYLYFYSKRYFHGCGTHPDMEEHREIAAELTAFLRKTMNW